MWTVAKHVVRHQRRGVERYALVLMLEPLFRCNLTCAGCGKIRQPAEVLRRQLAPEQCFAAAEECGAPVVSIPGGEPLLHPQIGEIVDGLVARGRYVYLCTNGLKLEEFLVEFRPSRHLAFNVHLDGLREEHDQAVGFRGAYDAAVRAIRAARGRGHRVTVNTTLYAGTEPRGMELFFDRMMSLGVEGITISPGYRYPTAPDQEQFLDREQSRQLVRELLGPRRRGWRFNQTPLYLEFLQGRFELECRPWGSPTYSVLGWQRPCYLLQDGYCRTFRELMETTQWSHYGHASGNAGCRDCVVHSGYEPSAVAATFGSMRGFIATVRSVLGLSRIRRAPIRCRTADRKMT